MEAMSATTIEVGDLDDSALLEAASPPEGQRIYERLGFTLASAPRMKRIL